MKVHFQFPAFIDNFYYGAGVREVVDGAVLPATAEIVSDDTPITEDANTPRESTAAAPSQLAPATATEVKAIKAENQRLLARLKELEKV